VALLPQAAKTTTKISQIRIKYNNFFIGYPFQNLNFYLIIQFSERVCQYNNIAQTITILAKGG
ncbi:MAG: hypothetical protein J6Q76_07510, partial [Clostridia bacterium]|nr:hypothetical protein [Clostridia bacterium]